MSEPGSTDAPPPQTSEAETGSSRNVLAVGSYDATFQDMGTKPSFFVFLPKAAILAPSMGQDPSPATVSGSSLILTPEGKPMAGLFPGGEADCPVLVLLLLETR